MYLIPIELSRKEACRSRKRSLSIMEFSFLPTKKQQCISKRLLYAHALLRKGSFFVIVFCAVDFFVLIFSCLYYLSSLKRTFLYLLFSCLHCLSFCCRLPGAGFFTATAWFFGCRLFSAYGFLTCCLFCS